MKQRQYAECDIVGDEVLSNICLVNIREQIIMSENSSLG